MSANVGDGPVLISGGTSGIGLGIAEYLVRSGRPVAVFGRDEHRVAAAQKHLASIGDTRHVLTRIADTTDEADLAALVESIVGRWGRLDGLVAAAGRLARGSLLTLTPAEFNEAWRVNVYGTWLAMRACVPRMKSQGHGRIVTIGSVLGATGAPERMGYAATKGGVAALTKSAALELARDGVTVNCVAPGPVRTAMNASDAADLFDDIIPTGRWGRPEDVAHIVNSLLADGAGWTTGSVMYVDGGYTAR